MFRVVIAGGAGRYLSPYLGAIEDAQVLGTAATPDGHPVELDLTH